MNHDKRVLLEQINSVLTEVIEDLDREGEIQLAEELFDVNFKILCLLRPEGGV